MVVSEEIVMILCSYLFIVWNSATPVNNSNSPNDRVLPLFFSGFFPS